MIFDQGQDRSETPAGDTLVDAEHFKQAFRALASGVSVVSFDVGDEVHGFTATSLTSVSMNPPLALFCIGNRTASRSHLEIGQTVGISLLGIDQVAIARAFANRTPEGGYTDIDIARLNGAPTVERALARIAAEITDLHPAGDHTVCICALRSVHANPDTRPLLYFSRGYHGHRPLIEEA